MSYDVPSGRYSSGSSVRDALLVQDLSRGLFDKHKFRAYREFTTETVVKLVFTAPFMLTLQKLWTGRGAARCTVRTGVTEGGVFTTLPTKFCLNTIGGDVPGLTTALVGGTLTGGTEREVLLADSGGGGGSGNGDLLGGTRLLGAGTYYMDIVPEGTTYGKWEIEWEEFPELA